MAERISFNVALSLNCTDLYKGGGGAWKQDSICSASLIIGLNIFISENNIHGNYNYCYIHKHNRIRTKAIYSRTSMARTLMARLPWLFLTLS